MPPVLGLDHLAIAVEDLDAATRVWRDRLGLRQGAREIVAEQGVEVQMMYAGDTRVELLRPLGPDSPIAGFLARRGPGLHHLALAVPDCREAVAELAAAGLRLIDREPRPGADGTLVAFVHPRSADGVLTELVEGGEGPWRRPAEEVRR
ncbi:MAG: methylmalonyl-CoA epimerase [Planctomycetota bacterium]|nr:MAG: methylmalonyl-CoA epimerase [Planctomycetota bacterium]